jgi:catalase
LFWNSMSGPEQDHIVGAFSFELGKCLSEEIKDRMLENLAGVAAPLVDRLAANLGRAVPEGPSAKGAVGDLVASPALSMLPSVPAPIGGRVVGILAADNADISGINAIRKPLEGAGAVVVIIAPHGGSIAGVNGDTPLEVTKSALTTQSVEYDALVVAGGPGAATLGLDPYTAVNLGEAYRHYKTIAAWGDGEAVLQACGIIGGTPGVLTADKPNRAFAAALAEAIGWHRHWDRSPAGASGDGAGQRTGGKQAATNRALDPPS